MSAGPLQQLLTGLPPGDNDAILGRFMEYVALKGMSLYAAQEEALLELMGGRHVILNTPTGSGKSLVATAMIFRTRALGGRAFYTCPIKALVSEKFFALCQDFGADQVGMMTGDATINRDAPIICCTAEILANLALRQGDDAKVDTCVVDEFHYYGDRDRGTAWQLPLLLLEKSSFLLMSATIGNPEFFAEKLKALTGRETAIVRSNERPVPLDYEYRETPLHETLEFLLSTRKHPIYLVNFTQRAAAEEAQNLMSVNFCTREEKQEINAALDGVRFDTPWGKDLQKFVRHGMGIHHAGLLPKYRLLVEKLAQQGLLKVISGTDTLGVGVNIPIRTVLFTRLCKYDGEKTVILSVREFKQVAGRAGRKGFDEQGSVVVQAPEHVIENLRIDAKKAGDPQKYKKLQKVKPPDKGFVFWDRQTFQRLVERNPEDLPSRFAVTHGMMLNLLQARPAQRGGGYGRLVQIIGRSHGDARSHKQLRRHAAVLFRALRHAGLVELVPVPMARGRYVEVNRELQRDFSLNHTLGLYLLDTIPQLDGASPTYALDLLTLVESILENPEVILARQLDVLKRERMAQLKAEHVEFEKRIEELDKMEYPKPNADFIYGTFNAFSAKHPWVGRENIRPKSVARDMYERGATFNEYVREYELQRVEGVLLRYLSDVYRAVVQNVPDGAKDDGTLEIIAYLRVMIRGVDSSLVDEWESLRMPQPTDNAPAVPAADNDLASQPRMLQARIRTEIHRLLKALSIGDWEDAHNALAAESAADWTPEKLEAAVKPLLADLKRIRCDHDARSPRNTRVTQVDARTWDVQQGLLDEEGPSAWVLDCHVDLTNRTGAEGPLLSLLRIGT